MKKLFLTLGAALLMIGASQAQTGFGLKAGVNLPSYNYGNTNDLSDTKSATSFHLTGYLDAPIFSGLSIQPGISLQGKGAKYAQGKLDGTSYSYTQNTMWVEVPVNLVAKVPVGVGRILLGAGPYAGYGISGKNKLNSVNSGTGDFSSTTLSEFDFGKNENLKSLDYGVNFLAGFKLNNGILLNANYGLGLADIAGSKNINSTVKNRVLSFGIGFEI